MSASRRVELLGVPFNSSGTTDGVARAPAALRDAGLLAGLRSAGVDVYDWGDVAFGPTSPERDGVSHVINPTTLAAMIRAVRDEIQAILGADRFPLVLGGDCPILLGCLSAADLAAPPGLLFVDGHEDAWPPPLSTSGEAADMELGFALGLSLDGLPGALIGEIPRLDPRRVLVAGPRDQVELAEASVPSIEGIVEITRVEALRTIGPETLGAEAGSRLARTGPWWFHVDLDVLDTASLGAVDYRQPGGLDWGELDRLTKGALASPNALGWDITIYNPDLDPSGTGSSRIVQYLVEALRR